MRVVDNKWMDHIDAMDVLKRGIGLKAYGNEDPVVAYKKEGFEMFDNMVERIQEDTVAMLVRVNVQKAPQQVEQKVEMVAVGSDGVVSKPATTQAKNDKVGRNDLCPCGSGKKYKACCGKE